MNDNCAHAKIREESVFLCSHISDIVVGNCIRVSLSLISIPARDAGDKILPAFPGQVIAVRNAPTLRGGKSLRKQYKLNGLHSSHRRESRRND